MFNDNFSLFHNNKLYMLKHNLNKRSCQNIKPGIHKWKTQIMTMDGLLQSILKHKKVHQLEQWKCNLPACLGNQQTDFICWSDEK